MKQRTDLQKAAEAESFGALAVGANRKHRADQNGGRRFTLAQNRALSDLARSLVKVAKEAGAEKRRVTVGGVSSPFSVECQEAVGPQPSARPIPSGLQDGSLSAFTNRPSVFHRKQRRTWLILLSSHIISRLPMFFQCPATPKYSPAKSVSEPRTTPTSTKPWIFRVFRVFGGPRAC